MKISQIFTSEEMSDKEKLDRLAELVTNVRAKYGNTDKEVETPKVSTVNGIVDFKYLDDESKVALAETEFNSIKTIAIEYCEAYDGAILDRKIEELIAISPVFANLTTKVDSQYL